MCRKWYNPSKLTLKHLDWSRCDPFWQNHGKGSVNWDQIFVINNNSIQNKMCKKNLRHKNVDFQCKSIEFTSRDICNSFDPLPNINILGFQSLFTRAPSTRLHNNISSVVEFQRWWVLKSKIFAMWWPGFKDFIWFFEMEEHGASEAHKNEFLNYEVLKI